MIDETTCRFEKHGPEQRDVHEEAAQGAGSPVPVGRKRDELHKDVEREFRYQVAIQAHHVRASVDDPSPGHETRYTYPVVREQTHRDSLP